MLTRFRTFCRLALPALLLAAGPATAQLLPTGPLPADPARARYAPAAAPKAQHRGTTAVSLPFFDDFTTPLEGPPRADLWKRGGAFVSNRLAIRPLTRGAATLDGLRANGQSYSGQITSPNGALDSLVSESINLATVTPADRVYLSFAWQAGSIVGVPSGSTSSPVRLELFVKTSAGLWESKWFFNAARQRTGFRQQVIDLNQVQYLHGDFQFMFVATGNTSENSDNWSIDYVLLNSQRSATDTTFVDVATGAGLAGGIPTGGLRSPLRRYTSMPVWQYNAASQPTSELNPNLGVNLTNLSGTLAGLPVDVQGSVRDLASGAPLGFWLQSSALLSGRSRQTPAVGSAASVALPITPDAKRLRYTLALNSREPAGSRTLANDTISRDLELANYYAYDDGTAEGITSLVPYTTGQQAAVAYRINLNKPDYVRGVRLYPVYPGTDLVGTTRVLDYAARTVTIGVWDDNGGRPATTNARVTKVATIPAQANIPAGWQYYQIDFDQPVPVTGTFYVGFSQPATSRFLPYGRDLNSSFPARHFWQRNNAGVWDTANFANPSALMMRPVMTNTVATATAPAQAAAAYSVYPNPAHGFVTVTGPAFARAALLDALGRVVWEQPAAQAGQPTFSLPTLPAGVYLVRLTLANGATVARRLLLE